MPKNHNIQRASEKKKGKPKLRFNFGMLLVIFILSFAGCFALYMLAANTNDNFFSEEFNSNVVINSEKSESSLAEQSVVSDSSSLPDTSAVTVTNPVPESAAADASYFEHCCLITDSTLLAIKDCTSFTDVIGSSQLNAASVNSVKLESSYGTVTAYETMKLKKPMNIYIMLGSDIGVSSVDEMIASYTTFINNLQASVSDSKIYIMQLPPVYADGAVTNEMINDYNNRLISLANSCGVYCIDTNTALKTVDGTLGEEYWLAENNSLTEKAYNDICGYILTHTT